MASKRLERTGRDVLTLWATVSVLLWLLAAVLIIRSYAYSDHIVKRSGERWFEWSLARGRFYVRACTFLPESLSPFDFEKNWGWETSSSPTRFVQNMRRQRQQFGIAPWAVLGFQGARGDPDRVSKGKIWRCFMEGPMWPVLLILAFVPFWWLRHRKSWTGRQRQRAVRTALLTTSILLAVPAILLALLFINSRFLGPREEPLVGRTAHPSVPFVADPDGVTVTIMTYNIHMGGAYRGAWRFADSRHVAERIDKIAALIRQQQPDIVFLQEVVIDAGPGSFDQTPVLAEKTGMHVWVFGQCVNDGFPFYRLIDGNAILSRAAIEPLTNQKMPGRKAFYEIAHDDQSTLWCKADIGGRDILLASVHLTSGDDDPGLQVEHILAFAGDRSAVLAGDFNLDPNEPELRPLIQTGQFAAKLDGPCTIYSHDPRRVIDYIFVPADWQLLAHHVIQTDLSDHLPVVCTYRVPRTAESRPRVLVENQ